MQLFRGSATQLYGVDVVEVALVVTFVPALVDFVAFLEQELLVGSADLPAITLE